MSGPEGGRCASVGQSPAPAQFRRRCQRAPLPGRNAVPLHARRGRCVSAGRRRLAQAEELRSIRDSSQRCRVTGFLSLCVHANDAFDSATAS
jgi:hypothetical protein